MDDREEIVIEEFKTSRKNIKNDGGEKMKKDYIIPVAYGIAMLLAILAVIYVVTIFALHFMRESKSQS